MGEVLAGLILAGWLWREREHARERWALLERIAGVSVEARRAPAPVRRVFGSDAEEWAIERERLTGMEP
jgi:hypothetical protein